MENPPVIFGVCLFGCTFFVLLCGFAPETPWGPDYLAISVPIFVLLMAVESVLLNKYSTKNNSKYSFSTTSLSFMTAAIQQALVCYLFCFFREFTSRVEHPFDFFLFSFPFYFFVHFFLSPFESTCLFFRTLWDVLFLFLFFLLSLLALFFFIFYRFFQPNFY